MALVGLGLAVCGALLVFLWGGGDPSLAERCQENRPASSGGGFEALGEAMGSAIADDDCAGFPYIPDSTQTPCTTNYRDQLEVELHKSSQGRLLANALEVASYYKRRGPLHAAVLRQIGLGGITSADLGAEFVVSAYANLLGATASQIRDVLPEEPVKREIRGIVDQVAAKCREAGGKLDTGDHRDPFDCDSDDPAAIFWRTTAMAVGRNPGGCMYGNDDFRQLTEDLGLDTVDEFTRLQAAADCPQSESFTSDIERRIVCSSKWTR